MEALKFIVLAFIALLLSSSQNRAVAQFVAAAEGGALPGFSPDILPDSASNRIIGYPSSDVGYTANFFLYQGMVWNEQTKAGKTLCRFGYRRAIYEGANRPLTYLRNLDTNITGKGAFARNFKFSDNGNEVSVLIKLSEFEAPDIAMSSCTLSNGAIIPIAIITGLYPVPGYGKIVATAFLYSTLASQAPLTTFPDNACFNRCHIAVPFGPVDHWRNIKSGTANAYFPTNASVPSTRIRRISRTCLRPRIDVSKEGHFSITWIENEEIKLPYISGQNQLDSTIYTYGNVYAVSGSLRSSAFIGLVGTLTGSELDANQPFFTDASPASTVRTCQFYTSSLPTKRVVEDLVSGPEPSNAVFSPFGYGAQLVSSSIDSVAWALANYSSLDIAVGDTIVGKLVKRSPVKSYVYFTEYPDLSNVPASLSVRKGKLTLQQVDHYTYMYPKFPQSILNQRALDLVYADLRSPGSIKLGTTKRFRIDQTVQGSAPYFSGSFWGKQVRLASTARMDTSICAGDLTMVLSATSDTAFSLPGGTRKSSLVGFTIRNGLPVLEAGTGNQKMKRIDFQRNPDISPYCLMNASVSHGRWTSTYVEEFCITFQVGERMGLCPDYDVAARVYNSDGSPNTQYFGVLHHTTRGNQSCPSVSARGSIYNLRYSACCGLAYETSIQPTGYFYRSELPGFRTVGSSRIPTLGLDRNITPKKPGDTVRIIENNQ